ncbi:MAG: phospholipase D-like domain-containing protein [Candidatus Bipolaricaulota bacterium]|nr:phospholipase D-like domain-containing protein [Candidatus Bipolaricaulota bacterium]
MCKQVQCRAVREGVLLFLILVAIGMGTVAETLVLPLIGRVGECSYCEGVEDAFDTAESSIDLLLSDARLEENPLWDNLLAAASRGVAVRVLLDQSDWAPAITEKNRPTIDYLIAHGIEARFDNLTVTTHSKLVIVDRRVVILGSTNWNHYAFTAQEQADVIVEDVQVGEVFASYFDRLWAGHLIENGVKLDLSPLDDEEPLIVPLPETVGTANYGRVLIELLRGAQQSVHVVMYRISHYSGYQESQGNEILQELIAAASRGLDVRILMDDCSFYRGSAEANLEAADYLRRHGVEVRMDNPDETTHAKLVIVDGASTILGSTNWNYYSLQRNNEVDLAFIDLPDVAAPYEAFFQALWQQGREP